MQNLTESDHPQWATDRITWRAPYPILHHHFGLPTMEATIEGIQQIAEAQALDLIALCTDQDARENFFHPERQDPRRKGVGGVPVRTPADFQALYNASQRGNFPMLCASPGTDDFIRYAGVLAATINNAWCAIPLFWFNEMDGRGPWDLEGSIRAHQLVMAWYGSKHIPVEINEPHHWSMRDAPDVIYVASAFLSAYNAKKFGVRDYIAQLILNSPPETSDAMDLAKMLAVLEIIQSLASEKFRIWRQTSIGPLSHPPDPDTVQAHLAASAYLQMALRPHICHIVGYTEADHVARADNIIQASEIVRRAITYALGAPDLTSDLRIQARKQELISEARLTLEAIRSLASKNIADPWTDATTLTRAVTSGILDAPQLQNNRYGQGTIRTRIIGGACLVVDDVGRAITERVRLAQFL